MTGASKPVLEGQLCHGLDLRDAEAQQGLELSYLIKMYAMSRKKTGFFNSFFPKLAGNTILKAQIEKGDTEAEIRNSWQQELKAYKAIRAKYLLYP